MAQLTYRGFVFFEFLVSSAEVLGPSEVYLKEGSTLNLTCRLLQMPEVPEYINWYRDSEIFNYSLRGGVSVMTDKNEKISRLLLSDAVKSDTGNYTCAPSSSTSASVIIHVVDSKYIAHL